MMMAHDFGLRVTDVEFWAFDFFTFALFAYSQRPEPCLINQPCSRRAGRKQSEKGSFAAIRVDESCGIPFADERACDECYLSRIKGFG